MIISLVEGAAFDRVYVLPGWSAQRLATNNIGDVHAGKPFTSGLDGLHWVRAGGFSHTNNAFMCFHLDDSFGSAATISRRPPEEDF